MRRSAFLAAVAFSLVVLAGCGGDDGSSATGGGNGKASGEVTVWAMGTEGEKLGVLAKDFMRTNPDVR